MNTDARRKAALAYKAKLASLGYRQKAFRFSPETLADLERLAKAAKLTEAQFIARLIAQAVAPERPAKPSETAEGRRVTSKKAIEEVAAGGPKGKLVGFTPSGEPIYR